MGLRGCKSFGFGDCAVFWAWGALVGCPPWARIPFAEDRPHVAGCLDRSGRALPKANPQHPPSPRSRKAPVPVTKAWRSPSRRIEAPVVLVLVLREVKRPDICGDWHCVRLSFDVLCFKFVGSLRRVPYSTAKPPCHVFQERYNESNEVQQL